MKEAIILCGGEGWRLKPDILIPKPLLEIIPGESILDRQIKWLLKYDFENIVLSSNRALSESKFFRNPKIQLALERSSLGTSDAVKRAFTLIDSDQFYVFNVDEIVFYNPNLLFTVADSGAAILLAKPKTRFGRATLDGDQVIDFEFRAKLDFWANAGHYVFSKDVITKYFTDKGPLEREVMQKIVKSNHLKGFRYEGDFLSINNVKDLIRIHEYFKTKQGTLD